MSHGTTHSEAKYTQLQCNQLSPGKLSDNCSEAKCNNYLRILNRDIYNNFLREREESINKTTLRH